MKKGVEIMEILEAFDLTGSFRAAGELAGCDHHTVKKYVQLRDAGRPVVGAQQRARLIDPFLAKIEEWVERTEGKARADVCHEKLKVMGYGGSPRTTRRAVAEVKRNYRKGLTRVFRPWITEPGLWLQFDWGEGPLIDGRRTNLFCAWLSWSRYRVVLPTWDRTLASLVSCLDQAFRLVGGVPTYALTDNEKTITTEHVAGIAVRNPLIARVGEHYGIKVATCVPADPQTKGGSEATVRIAKADLLPLRANLRPNYRTFGELESACEAFMAKVNNRVHRVTHRVPSEMLLEERRRLHVTPSSVFVQAAGDERRVGKDATVVFAGARYSVPHAFATERVLVREHGDDVIITHAGDADGGLREIARHLKASKGGWRIDDSHYPATPAGPLERRVTPKTALEREFLELGPGAESWLRRAAEVGVSRIRSKMQHALNLADYHAPETIDAALEVAARVGRFDHDDVARILAHQAAATPGAHVSAFEAPSLQAGTNAWEGFGR